MQFPESWLRTFCNPPLSTQQLADTLTMAGLEVEALTPVAPPFSGVLVGRILSLLPHPNADRLRVCQVDVGAAQPLSIVCGAPNARAGILVPCATVGAQLPPLAGGPALQIGLGQLRGVQSQGMLCSAKELGLSDENGGLLELAPDAPPGRDLRAQLALDDQLFTLKLTTNLAHCLSVYGIARELAALTGAPLQEPEFSPAAVSLSECLPVRVDAPDLCGRFSGRIVRGVNTRVQTPAWMVERLARCGQRSVSPLVDISNYVMFELGRPSHIFDLDKISGGLQVRWGRSGETLTLLNGNTIALDEQVGVIADERAVESLAGIMGGAACAVSEETRHIFIEAAFWWPQAIAGRSRRYHFSTDAGHRFERGVDPSTTRQHVERITQLVLQICGGQAATLDDQIIRLPLAQPVTLRVARAAKVLGIPLTQPQCAAALQRLGLEPCESEGSLTVTPPPYRFDLHLEEDLIEEVARVIGYQNLPHTPPHAPICARIDSETRRSPFAVRRALAQLGYQETINFSFVQERWEHELAGNPNPIRLLNPISSQLSVLRSSLLGSLLAVLKFNLDHRAERVRLFEVGRVFRKDQTVADSERTLAGVDQPMRVAGLCQGGTNALQWGLPTRAVDFYDVKGDVQALLAPRAAEFRAAEHPAMHPGRCASVWLDQRCIGHVGELHPRWRQSYELAQAPVLFELALDAVQERTIAQHQTISRHQSAARDLALVVKESVDFAAVQAAIGAACNPWLRDLVLFDVYRPKAGSAGEALASDEKSLAVRLLLRRDDATLTEEEIDAAVKAVLESLVKRVQARLRA